MTSAKMILGISVAVIIILALAAAFVLKGGFQSTSTSQTTPQTQTTSQVSSDKVLRVSFAWPNYIDPAVGSDYASATTINNLYDPLVYPKPGGGVVPWVAESWNVSDNGTVWTFHIRKGILFHDGSELTANDVVFSMKRLLTIKEGFSYLFLPYIDSVEAKDNYTVVFKLKSPYGPFLDTLTRFYILNSKLVMEHIAYNSTQYNYGQFGDYGRNWLLTHDAGSGPYTVKSFQLESQVVLQKFPNYWAGLKPNSPDTAIFIGTTDPSTVRTLLMKRELEISDQWQPKENYDFLSNVTGISIANIPSGDVFYLMLNTKLPPTDDINLRKALAWGFDYNTVINQIFPGSPRACGPIAPSLPGALPNQTCYNYDPQKALDALKQSKYYGQLDKYPIEYDWVAEVPDEEKVALLFKANMQQLGITVNVVKKPWLSVVQEMSNLTTSPNIVSIFDGPVIYDIGPLLLARYSSQSLGTWEQNEWLMDSKLDSMIMDALKTINQTERYQKYYEIQQYIIDLVPTIFTFEQLEKHAYQSYYVDWPQAKGEGVMLYGYSIDLRSIQVFPDKRAQLLSGSTTASKSVEPAVLAIIAISSFALSASAAVAAISFRKNLKL
ncbi:MAG: ABC transporter substrate-binding protein [Desulfurococcales archaeon]|jgi:peptide/nickel transport system substrate-binding protein|nr:ABC transporter substrate-binding protein [Desulfurococcales archaeon]